MRTIFSRNDSDSGDFSVAFGDMMFGMLFIFFLFAMVLVFSRPDVESYQREENKLLKNKAQADEVNRRLELKVAELKRELERSDLAMSKLQGGKETARRESESYSQEIRSLKKDLDELREKNIRSIKDNAKFDDALDRRAKEVEEWRRTYEDTVGRISEIEAERDIARRLFASCKEILKGKGLQEVLAEVEVMEKGPAASSGTTATDSARPQENYKINAKLFGKDDVNVRILKGEAQLYEGRMLSTEQVLSAANELIGRYRDESASYSETEKSKYAPRLYLMSNPEATYGSVQDFMKALSAAIQIQIVPWTE